MIKRLIYILLKYEFNTVHNVINKKENKKLKYFIFSKTKFLDEKDKVSINELIYCIFNNIDNIPKYKICSRNFVDFISITKGYRKYCLSNCSIKYVEIYNKVK